MPMCAPFFGFFGHQRNESGKSRKLRIRCWVVLLSLAKPAARQLSTVIAETCASLAVKVPGKPISKKWSKPESVPIA